MGAAPASGGLCEVLLKKHTTHSRAVGYPFLTYMTYALSNRGFGIILDHD